MSCNDEQNNCAKNHVVFGSGKVVSCKCIVPDSVKHIIENQSSGGVYHLVLKMDKNVSLPKSGQFYMLRNKPSKVLLSRAISVYDFDENEHTVDFLILKKGNGTAELCSVEKGAQIEVLGPQGNCFDKPLSNEKVAIIGGGIGVAPVAGFAITLPSFSYDFYACFKTGSYGLEKINANKLIISTDDGSVGIKGMLPIVFNEKTIIENGYSCVYACGPEPMLKYVQKLCSKTGIKCFLSMEARMACGMGACLGCTIATTEGNKRCCVDGPVFSGEKIIFAEKKILPKSSINVVQKTLPVNNVEPSLSVTIAGVKFENPVIAASGTFGYGHEYETVFDINALGGICSKGLTLEKREGNTGIRLQETASGVINSIGLENPGIESFIQNQQRRMLELKPVTIVNLSGSSIETYVKGAELLEKTSVPMIELNISCPNVKAGGMAFGLQPEAAFEVTEAVRNVTTKPLIVKLSPNAPDLIAVADSVRKAGADALSLVNTFQAMAIDVEKGSLIFDNIKAGLAGPAIKPMALRMVYDVCQYMKNLNEKERIPVIGLGGISSWQDAVEFIMVGASAIQVGTSTFANPHCMIQIIEGITDFMKRKGYKSLEDFRGII